MSTTTTSTSNIQHSTQRLFWPWIHYFGPGYNMIRRTAKAVPHTIRDAQNRVVIDLTQEDDSPSIDLPVNPRTNQKMERDENTNAVSLRMILDIFPDVSIQYALDLIGKTSPTSLDCERIIAQMLDGGDYPKEKEESARRKRKRESEDIGDRHDAGPAAELDHDYLEHCGEVTDCLCCYDEFPINCMMYCDGEIIHFFCSPCTRKYVEQEIGLGRCRPACFADPNCRGAFSRAQLLQSLGKKTFDRLDHMVQQQELAAARLDFLSECPFCDFKAECPPIEVDKEFRCENPKCLKVSCRLCAKDTHVPLTCEEKVKQDGKLAVRHTVEEAMSKALIRRCNKCNQPFVKEEGCNKMTCSCGNVQCYVCSKNVKDYRHFKPSGCPLHDNVQVRHEHEVKKAAEKAMAKAQAQNPDMTEQDLQYRYQPEPRR